MIVHAELLTWTKRTFLAFRNTAVAYAMAGHEVALEGCVYEEWQPFWLVGIEQVCSSTK